MRVRVCVRLRVHVHVHVRVHVRVRVRVRCSACATVCIFLLVCVSTCLRHGVCVPSCHGACVRIPRCVNVCVYHVARVSVFMCVGAYNGGAQAPDCDVFRSGRGPTVDKLRVTEEVGNRQHQLNVRPRAIGKGGGCEGEEDHGPGDSKQNVPVPIWRTSSAPK